MFGVATNGLEVSDFEFNPTEDLEDKGVEFSDLQLMEEIDLEDMGVEFEDVCPLMELLRCMEVSSLELDISVAFEANVLECTALLCIED